MNSFKKNTRIKSYLLHLANFHLLFRLVIGVTEFPLASHGCHEEERRALLNFKSLMTDPADRHGKKADNITTAVIGKVCSSESFHVISIDLRNIASEMYKTEFTKTSPPYTGLRGKISPSIFNITHLEYLDLAWNDFQESDELTLQLTNLTKLIHLDLSNSRISGSITTQFTNLSSLQYLDLSCESDPYVCLELPSMKWVRQLVNLKVLSLSHVDLSVATSSENNFAEDISHLADLRDLDLTSCNISGSVFPIHKFHNFSRLSSLKMSRNHGLNSAVPQYLTNLTSLSILELSGCDLRGSFPQLSQLKELYMSWNYDLHVDLTKMFKHSWPKLQTFSISQTKVTGSFRNFVSNAPRLVNLNAPYCYIQGSIPKSICKISSLQKISLNHNKFTGSIPSCITDLENLNLFDVRSNSIKGKVSLISLVNKLNLTFLDLSSNRLTVVIDRHLVPSKFELETLNLRSCNLKGVIPPLICSLTHLKELDLSNNMLTGHIPSCIFEFKNANRFQWAIDGLS